MKHFIGLFFILSFGFSALAALPEEFAASDLITGKEVHVSTKKPERKGLVIVFMSAKCPCSDSHVAELKKVATKYSQFEFVAIHSNSDESPELAKTYFTKAALPFPVLQDTKAKLADDFKALKTPHAFVLNSLGEIVYQGGVTNSANAAVAGKHFLADALEDISQSHAVSLKNGRTLGCIILRADEKNVW